MKKKMTAKQITAIIAIALLAGMYLVSLIFALIHSELALNLLKISLIGTIAVPTVIYLILMFTKLARRSDPPEENNRKP